MMLFYFQESQANNIKVLASFKMNHISMKSLFVRDKNTHEKSKLSVHKSYIL